MKASSIEKEPHLPSAFPQDMLKASLDFGSGLVTNTSKIEPRQHSVENAAFVAISHPKTAHASVSEVVSIFKRPVQNILSIPLLPMVSESHKFARAKEKCAIDKIL
jgi:hypothetical protein